MNQEEFNERPTQTVLYYCYQENKQFYQSNAADVCIFGYNDKNDLVITDWLIGSPSQPSIEALMSYTAADVDLFFANCYQNPEDINRSNGYPRLSSEQLAAIPDACIPVGFFAYDTTLATVVKKLVSGWAAL